jgi:hypothetical protein
MLNVFAAQRFAQANQLELFSLVNQGEIERFWRPLRSWLTGRVPRLTSGYSLDLDPRFSFGMESTRETS